MCQQFNIQLQLVNRWQMAAVTLHAATLSNYPHVCAGKYNPYKNCFCKHVTMEILFTFGITQSTLQAE